MENGQTTAIVLLQVYKVKKKKEKAKVTMVSITVWVCLKVIKSYQCGVAGKEQNFYSEALCNQSFLAEFTDPPHHHQCFSIDHIWLDPSGITQQGGGHVHQWVLKLEG